LVRGGNNVGKMTGTNLETGGRPPEGYSIVGWENWTIKKMSRPWQKTMKRRAHEQRGRKAVVHSRVKRKKGFAWCKLILEGTSGACNEKRTGARNDFGGKD